MAVWPMVAAVAVAVMMPAVAAVAAVAVALMKADVASIPPVLALFLFRMHFFVADGEDRKCHIL